MNVRGILQKFRYGSSDVTVVVVDGAKNEKELNKLEILCPAMTKGNVGDEIFASFAVKDNVLKIYTK